MQDGSMTFEQRVSDGANVERMGDEYTAATLLRATGAELKIMQEPLRHSTIRVTLDTYTQAVTTAKRTAPVGAIRFRCCSVAVQMIS